MKKYIVLFLITSTNAFATDLPDITHMDISAAVMLRCLIAADQYSKVDVNEAKM